MKFQVEMVALGVTIAGLLGTGGMAYGSLVTKQEATEHRLEAVEQAPEDIAAIKASQAAMERDISEIRKDQRAILKAVAK